MGLDMYLYTSSQELAKRVNEFNIAHGYSDVDWMNKACLQDGEIGYWRKFHELHQYFVEHVQYGEDNCTYYEIQDLDILQNCRDKLQYALDNPEDTECEFAPQIHSIFNVSTTYDWYWRDVKYTIDLFDFLLDNLEYDNKHWSYFVKGEEPAWNPRLLYRASW